MQNIVIDKKGCTIGVERKLLLIEHTSLAKTLKIPFAQIQSLTITTQVDLSSHLLTRLAEHNISVCVLPNSRTGEACFLLGSWHAGTRRREVQYAIVNDESAKSYWASVLVRLKLQQQAQTLFTIQQRLLSDDMQSNLLDMHETSMAIQKINSLRDKFRRYNKYNLARPMSTNETIAATAFDYNRHLPQYPIASILGTEGIGSAVYFQCYQHFFAEHWQFDSRNRRPPKDPINVVLSLSYTLLQHICQQAVYSIGFDPYRGVLHSPSYGRQSLACDFVELQRGVIDLWVWELFAQGILDRDDFSFSNTDGYPCELLKSGRAKYYKAFAGMRSTLSKNALRHVWIWQRRLKHYHPSHHVHTESADLSFISQLSKS